MKKLTIISLFTFLAVSASARIHVKSNDPKGLESTEYRYDYSDGKKTEIVCNSVEDINVAIRNLSMNSVYSESEDGCAVEYSVGDALFSNFAYNGYPDYDFVLNGQYYWYVKSGILPSEFYRNPDNIDEGDFDAPMLPGIEERLTLLDGYTLDDVEVTVESIDTSDIGETTLANYSYVMVGKPAMRDGSPTEEGYLPEQPCRKITRGEDGHSLIVYFGQYNPETWNLKAVTGIKVSIKGAHIADRGSSVRTIQNGQLDGEAVYYDIHGRSVTDPVPGTIYIKDGKKIINR